MAMTFGALMMLGLAVPAQAADPTFIEPTLCHTEQRVAAQSDVTLYYGWATDARRQAVKFLERSRVELTVDGQLIANADLLWSKPVHTLHSGWVTIWEYKLGRLGRDNSIDTNFKLIFDEPSWDGVAWYGPGTFANYDCRVFTRA